MTSPGSSTSHSMQKPCRSRTGCWLFDVETHDLGRETAGDEPRQPADRAFLALEIEQRDVAFGRGIEFDDLRDLEPLLEFRPDVGPQPVAAGQAQADARAPSDAAAR